ncbi:MAG: HD domain-containing phosphohydrolase [Acidobacteriota bacterium]
MNGILIVNHDLDQRKALADVLKARGRAVEVAGTIKSALKVLARSGCEQVISVRTLPDGSGELLIQQAAEIAPGAQVTLVTNFSQVRGPADILRFDFTDYILDVDDLAGLVTGSLRGPSPGQRELVECFLRTVEAVVGLVELADPLSAGHAASSLRLAQGIAREMGLGVDRRQEIALAALLHDIGNFALSPALLGKSDPLQPDEEDRIRQHTRRGWQVLEHIKFPWNIKSIVLHHHERYDGKGYPDGKKGRGIAIGARILAVVDAYLSMTSRRPHRSPLGHDEALKEIHSRVGSQFDPEVVEAFDAFVERRRKYSGDIFQVKVMVLDHGQESLSRMKLHFLREEFMVLSGGNVEEALARVKSDDVRFVVADISNNWNEALTLLDGLQERIDTSKTDVLFFDGNGSRERRVTALDNGTEEVFPLDVGPAEVISRMRRILRKEEAVRKGSTLARDQAGISGDLAEMSLAEIIQMLSMGQKTARVTVKGDGIQGEIYLESGRLTHTVSGSEEGTGCLRTMLSLAAGRFTIEHGVTTAARSIDKDAMSVLLDVLKEMDESGRVSPSA